MQTKKICMIGDFAVGKTSLISRYVHNQFSADYLTTIGVKIDTKELILDSGDPIKLVLWDIAGTDSLATIGRNYLKGAAGYFLVVDGTRSATFDVAVQLQQQTEQELGNMPFSMLLNKQDLDYQWSLNNDAISGLESQGWSILKCSAKGGDGVEDAFKALGKKMVINTK